MSYDAPAPRGPQYAGMTPQQEETVKKEKIRLYARMIWSNRQLKDILLDAKPDLRRGVYDMLKPHLRFNPKPYFLLVGAAR